MLEFDDDSDKEFFDNPSNAGSDAGFAAGSDAEVESEAGSAAAEPSDAEDANTEPAEKNEPAVPKPIVPRPTATSEEEEASSWWKPASPLAERQKWREEEDKRQETKAGLASSHWAPRPPSPQDPDSFWM